VTDPRPEAASGSAPTFDDRRAHRRVQVDYACAATTASGESIDARVVDLSRGGARLMMQFEGEAATLPVEGDALELCLAGGGDARGEARRRGQVVWRIVDQAGGVLLGLAFQPPSSPDRGLLDLDQVKIDPIALRIPARLARRRQLLPFASLEGEVYVAMADPTDARAIADVQRALRAPVRPEAADPASLARAIDRVYVHAVDAPPGEASRRGASLDASIDVESAADPSDPVALSQQVLGSAVLRGASDVHIAPQENHVEVRLRVDGVLEPLRELTLDQGATLVSRFKVLAGLDIAERRAPQDGRFRHELSGGKDVDVRVATLPTRHGEWMTLRLLALDAEALTLERLGMTAGHLELFLRAIHQPHGLILLTGPTGSGKTTTLYAGIRKLMAERDLNILTIEDPVEYDIPGVGQVGVDTAQKVTFAKALRSALRNDPDVIMVGEIRDAETADVAIKAALTGHLVLSTLHTNSAPGVITRLRDMGVPSYLTAAVLRLAVAQRLVRRLCHRCRRPVKLDEVTAAALGRPEEVGRVVSEPVGCVYCASRGYVGRAAIFEMLPGSDELATLISREADEPTLTAYMTERRLPKLADDAASKLFDGWTDPGEVLRHVSVS